MLAQLGDHAFYSCTQLTDIDIPISGMSPSKYRKESHRESTKEQLQEVEGLIARLLKP